MRIFCVNKRPRIPRTQSKKDNPEKTGNIRYISICVGHHYEQINTDKVNNVCNIRNR